MKEYNKKVTVNGQISTVRFINKHVSRDFEIVGKVYHNTHEFIINNKSYLLKSVTNITKSGKYTTTYNYNGVIFPDSEKKIIEYILAN